MHTYSVTLITLDSCLFVSLTSYKHRKDPVAHFVFPNKPTGGVFWSWWMSKCGWSGDLAASSFVLFLTCMVLRQKNTMYRRKVISQSNCVGMGKPLFWKATIVGGSEAAWPWRTSYRCLSGPLSGVALGGQPALRAHYQMGSRWNFSPFMLDFTADQVHYRWNVGLLSPSQQWLVSVAIRGKNCSLLMYSNIRTDMHSSWWNFKLLGLQG